MGSLLASLLPQLLVNHQLLVDLDAKWHLVGEG